MSNAKRLLISVGFTICIAFAIVVIGRMVLLGYERFFDALMGRQRVAGETNTPQLDMVFVSPAPTPFVGEDFVPEFEYGDEIGLTAHEETLPDPISITPLSSLVMYAPGTSLELPVVGATGWAGARIEMRHSPMIMDDEDLPPRILSPGQEFVILIEWGDWWYVRLPSNEEGWVRHEACLINLPDVIPSLVFNITNASGSIKVSGDFDIAGITNVPLYDAHSFNHRYGRSMYIVPALYATAKRLFYVQQAALAGGDTLVIYEVFRPHSTQQLVVSRLNDLMRENSVVRTALNTHPWSPNWFISHGVSSHQRGAAIDATLARVVSYEIAYTADFMYSFRRILEYVPYQMPTPMHDLHPNAAVFIGPGSSTFTDSMTEGAKLLQSHFIRHGFTPLASEWWHFNDPRGVELARSLYITGAFYTQSIMSFPPSFGG